MTDNKKLDELAHGFFYCFSRTEYALKASGFNKGDGKAEANWRNFAQAVEDLIANPISQALKDAVDFLLQAPPKQQVIVGGNLEWKESPPKTNSRADELLTYVRRVRNNLFHGGKFNGHWFAPERSELLIKHSLVVLEACVDFVPKVRDAYNG